MCAFRQTGCVWEINCGNNPLLQFTGRVEPDDTGIEWRLATGTPCEASFDASGRMTGMCTVPGEEACQLRSTTAVPGGETCPVIPNNGSGDFYARGCGDGGGRALDCRLSLQHGCAFMAACDFSGRFQRVLIAGESSYDSAGEQGHLEFNGVNGFDCYVDEATADDVLNDSRAENEWYGQCVNPETGGMCRDNYDPETGSGFRGLQLFFE